MKTHSLTQSQITTLFCGYYGQHILLVSPGAKSPVEVNSYRINKMENGESNYLLALAPMTKITDEHALIVAAMYLGHMGCLKIYRKFWDSGFVFIDALSPTRYSYIQFSLKSIEFGHIDFGDTDTKIPANSKNNIPAFDMLRSLGYDVPIFVSPYHEDNGSTMIELGLALDATLKAYKTPIAFSTK